MAEPETVTDNDWPLRDEHRARHLGIGRRRKDPADKVVKAFTAYGMPAGILDPACVSETDVQVLLAAIAAALNACERAGFTVKLAHGTVLTPVGYVLPIFPDAGERFAVRTMALTEFSVAPDGSDED